MKKLILTFILVFITLSSLSYASVMSSDNYEMSSMVIDIGGGELSSTNYELLVAIGQPVIGVLTSDIYNLYLGFIYTLRPEITCFTPKKADGCECETNEECYGGLCTLGICMTPIPPVMNFVVGENVNLQIGPTANLVLKLKNPLPLEDSINLDISGDKISYWSWFEGHKYDEFRTNMDILVDSKEEVSVSVNTIPGEVGTYNLKVIGESELTGLSNSVELTVNIGYESKGLFSRTPDISWLYFVLIILISSLLVYKKV